MKQITRMTWSLVLFCCMGLFAQAQTTNIDLTINTGTFPAEISWELLDGSSSVVSSSGCGVYATPSATIVVPLVLNNGETYTFNAFDDWGDGWNGGSWTFSNASSGCVIGTGLANNFIGGDNNDDCAASQLEESFSFQPDAPISGCTNPLAANFNPCATVDDGSCVLPAANDLCGDAIAINVGECYVGSNVGATFGPDALSPTCVDGSASPADIWFSTTVPASGSVLISFPQTPGFSSIIEVYQGGNCGALPAGILASAGACTNYAAGGSVILSGLAPGALLIRYWDFGSNDFGTIEVCVAEVISGCTDVCANNFNPLAVLDDGSCTFSTGPANGRDDCSAAALLPGAGTYNAITSTATSSGGDITSCTFADSLDVWYRYNVPTGLDTLWIYTCNSSYDTGLSLWDGCPSGGGVEIACNDDAIRPGVGTSTSTCGINPATGLPRTFQSAISLTDSALLSVAGSTIWIRVAGFGGQDGCGDLTVEEVRPPCDPSIVPSNQVHTLLASSVRLNWTPTPGAVACQVQGKRLPSGPQPSQNITTPPYNQSNVPFSVAGAGTTWTWRVRCACQVVPSVIATAFSPYGDTFSIPAAREGDMLSMEDMIFPNPANQEVYVTYNSGSEVANVSFTVVDMVGRVVAVQQVDVMAGANQVRFDVSNLVDGLYFVNIVNGAEETTHQFTVTH
jgi:hypothetical protein